MFMLTVRFPNGQAVQYNNAIDVVQSPFQGMNYLMAKGGWIAIIPNTCIVEWERACQVYNPLENNKSEQIEKLTKKIRLLKKAINTGKRTK